MHFERWWLFTELLYHCVLEFLLIKETDCDILYWYYYVHTTRKVSEMEKILSVIIPSYNCSQFLDKGIPTFLDPAVLDSLDIIIVNDGSTDDTAAAAEKYCRRFPDSIRLINQENKGHGGALNTGCAAAVGKYLRVVDADDWVETQNLKPFVEFLRSCESDVVLTDYDTVDISNGEIKVRRMPEDSVGKDFTLEDLMADRVNNEQILSLLVSPTVRISIRAAASS